MKALLKTVPLFIALALCATNTYAEEIKAPFGLTWGVSQAELAAMNIVGRNPCPDDKDGTTKCRARKVPKPVSFGDDYSLYFHPTSGLVKVLMESFQVGFVDESKNKNLPQGREQHALVKASLTAKYGAPDRDRESGTGVVTLASQWFGDSGGSIEWVTVLGGHGNVGTILLYASNILAKMRAERATEQIDEYKDSL